MLDLHGYGPSIFMGAILTVELAVLSAVIAVLLGLVTAMARLSKNRVARGVATLYSTVVRGVPDLVLMLLIFFGAQIMMNNISDWLYEHYEIDVFFNIDEFTAGVSTIGFIFGAYMAETFRGAFLAVDRGQLEAGTAYGMSPWMIFRRVMFPQMMRHALPGIGNNWLVLVKTTALVSVIGLADMTRLAKEAAGAVNEPFKFFIPVAIVYLLITSVSELGLKRLERKFSAGVVRG
ncbi:ABC transporter [Grimontia hollisae]|uniref:Arginine/ornithine ABC transporter permease protein AotQ n=1 Tax=Grimontia hollisae CIP 101886 TaxID=675812 RepID=D0I7A9_GRIHO|nr:ABC transporter permease [Grimontia hollisae]AMG31315.1 ABC transporter [Grimontia hollisae]EEY72528.1 arginine/ornithine ABC transporter permease protein AotQ [Grimontia hollisae CIP 101886]MDF2185646.1 ABC transporter permease [Grimontia hollisae]STO45999.1 Histidine transport system permease protein hisQ [Grimontia hollisae]STQ76639.1 Histidine transport system permease protein hisQ [Grimontia hollisae]